MKAQPSLARMVLGGSPAGLGGAQRVIQGIEARLDREGWRVEWFSPAALPRLPASRRYPGLNEALRSLALARALRGLPVPALTISHGMFGAGARGRRIHAAHGTSAGLADACRAGIPRLDYLVGRWVNGTAEQLAGASACRVAVSRRVEREVRRYYGQCTHRVLHNGVDADHFRPAASRPDLRARLGLPSDAHLMLIVGRMDYGKGREVLRALLERLPADYRAVLAAPEVAGLERLPPGRVIPLGPVSYDDLPAVYGACDVLLCLSLYEGFGLTLFEAWGAGLPVVTHRIGIVEELLGREPTFDAATTPVGDTAALAEGVTALREDPARAGRQAAWGRELLREEFSLTRCQDEWWRLILDVR